MKTSTVPVSAAADWRVIDATGMKIGRLSTRLAMVLRGKHKPSFSPHQLCGDHVIVLNAEKLDVSPEKARRKTYVRHTGYFGHISFMSLGKMMEKSPEKVIEKAVYGMLPRNRLRLQMMKRLHVFTGSEHPYAAQKPTNLTLA